MKNTVIIGSSAAGYSLAMRLRAKSGDCPITVVTEEEYAGYDRRKLLGYFAGSVKEKELYPGGADAYGREKIDLLKGCRCMGINPARRTVYLKYEDRRDSIPYDLLIVCSGTAVSLPEITGIHKEGVFAFNGLADVKAAKSCVINGPVCLSGPWDTHASRLAECLLAMKKEVLLITPEPPEQAMPGITVVNSVITEFIGESGLQAVKLREGKIIGTSFCLLTGPRSPAAEFLAEAGIRRRGDGSVEVAEGFRTSLDNVFACGPVTGSCDSWDEAAAQGTACADLIAEVVNV